MNQTHIAHALHLARSQIKTDYENICSNFRMAALYLSYMLEMPGIPAGKVALPDIPDKLQDLLTLDNAM